MAGTSLTVTTTAQSARLKLQTAVTNFKNVIGDPELVEDGQFIWAFRYEQEMLKLARPIVRAASSAVRAVWGNKANSNKALVDLLIADAGNSRRAGDGPEKRFETKVQNTLADKSWQDGSLQANTLIALLKDPGNGGPRCYLKASDLLTNGKRVLPNTPEFQQSFPRQNLSFRGALRINQSSASKCFDMSRAVCRFVEQHGGLGVAPTRLANDPGQIFDQKRKFAAFKDPLGDLVDYSAGLKNAIRLATVALDRGHLLNCGVASGIRLNGPIEKTDHFLPILSWARFEQPFKHLRFAFWDPDAAVTDGMERGFGQLFFLAGPEAQAQVSSGPNVGTPRLSQGAAYAPAFYAQGRLTTARTEASLACDQNGTDSNGQHRYQVITMEAIPGRFPRPRKKQ